MQLLTVVKLTDSRLEPSSYSTKYLVNDKSNDLEAAIDNLTSLSKIREDGGHHGIPEIGEFTLTIQVKTSEAPGEVKWFWENKGLDTSGSNCISQEVEDAAASLFNGKPGEENVALAKNLLYSNPEVEYVRLYDLDTEIFFCRKVRIK